MGHGTQPRGLPERLFQGTGDGSGQCPRARLRKPSQSHVCRLLSVRAVTELRLRRFEQRAEGTFCGRNDQESAAMFGLSWSVEKREGWGRVRRENGLPVDPDRAVGDRPGVGRAPLCCAVSVHSSVRSFVLHSSLHPFRQQDCVLWVRLSAAPQKREQRIPEGPGFPASGAACVQEQTSPFGAAELAAC